MSVGLGWLGVGVGAAGCVVTYLLACASAERPVDGSPRGRGVWWAAGLAAVLTLVFWGISLKTRAPFSPGQTLGWGFLIGGALGTIAIAAMPRFDALGSSGSTRTRYLLACCASFLALLGASLTYTIFHGYPQVALIGFAIGTVMSGVLARAVFATDAYVDLWSIFAVMIAAATILAVLHFDSDTQRQWWALPILLATTACVVGYIGIEIGSAKQLHTRPGLSMVLAAIVSAVLVLALSTIYAWKIANDWQFLGAVGIGVVVAAAVAWLAASAARGENVVRAAEASAICPILVVALAVVAFKMWSGLGIALALIGAWSVMIPAAGLDEQASRPLIPRATLRAIWAGAAILLFRLFVEQYRGDLGSTDLRIHYTFIGALLGYVAPMLFAIVPLRLGARAPWIALAGFLAAASPLVVFVVWGIKATMGFMFGLTAVAVFGLAHILQWGGNAAAGSARSEEQPGDQQPETSDAWFVADLQTRSIDYTPPLLLGAMLAAIQFTAPLMTIEDTRTLRIYVVGAVVLLGVAWLVVTGIIDRRRAQ